MYTFANIVARLEPIYREEAKPLTQWILEELFGVSALEAIRWQLDEATNERLETVIGRLLQNEPIQYIFGHTQWHGLDFFLTPATLIPRPETGELVDWILQNHNQTPIKLLDIGTGSGCIAIALKHKRPSWTVLGVDISPEAVNIATKNAQHNQVDVKFACADVFSDEIMQLGPFDVVVSNPPYICNREKSAMSANVLQYEPAQALFVPDETPLLFYSHIAQMRLGKRLYFETNERYATDVAEMLTKNNYTDVQIQKDIYDKERMVCGTTA